MRKLLAALLLALLLIPSASGAQQKVLGVATTAAPTYSTNTWSPFSMDLAGNLRVNVTAGGATGVAQGSTTSGQLGSLMQCATTTTNPTYVNGTTNPCDTDTAGNLRVTGGVAQGSTTSGQLGSLIMGAVLASDPSYTTAQTNSATLRTNGHLTVEIAPSSLSVSGITASANAAAGSNVVLKAGAGNLYSFEVTTGASAGLVYVFNATSLPGNGAITPVKCYAVAANSTFDKSFGPPLALATGITVGFGTGTNCFSLTASATAFISGEAM